MSTKLMSPRGLQSAALRVIGLLVVAVALVAGLSRLWVAQEQPVLPAATAMTAREPAFAFAEQQQRAVAESVGPVGAVRLTAAGEVVTEANGTAWIGSPGDDTVAVTTMASAADILAFHEAQMAQLRDVVGEAGLQRLRATGDSE